MSSKSRAIEMIAKPLLQQIGEQFDLNVTMQEAKYLSQMKSLNYICK